MRLVGGPAAPARVGPGGSVAPAPNRPCFALWPAGAAAVPVPDGSGGAAASAVVTVRGHGPQPRQFYTKRLAADTSLIPTLMAAGVEFGVLKQSFVTVLVRCY